MPQGLGMRDRRGWGWGDPGQVPAEPLVLLGWLCTEGLGKLGLQKLSLGWGFAKGSQSRGRSC